MKASTYIMPPTNWQDFEELCKRIWEHKWNNPDDIVRNGRMGQRQSGVDVSAYVEDKKGYCGVQCKGKDNYAEKLLTQAEIDAEIEKAKEFKPALKSLIFATTAIKDANLEEYVRQKNITNIEKGLFSVAIFSWEDIVSLIEQYKSVKDWYVYEKLQSFEPEIKILMNGKIGTKTEPIILRPQYTKQHIFYIYIKPSLSPFSLFNNNDISPVTNELFKQRQGNSVELSFEIINNGEYLENCLFSIFMENSTQHKFYNCENKLEELSSPYFIDEFEVRTKNEFTLHGGCKKNFNFFIELSEQPIEEEFVLKWNFTSKQNKKPYSSEIHCKTIPQTTELPNKEIQTNRWYKNSFCVETKPKKHN